MTQPALTPRQECFVREFLKDFNANEAYRRAGYACGRKPFNSWNILNGPRVRAAIEAAQREAVRDVAVDAARIVRRYAAIAFASVGDIITIAPDGTFDVDVSAVDPERLAAFDACDVTERPVLARYGGGRIRRLRVRLAGKLGALDALARHLGLLDGEPNALASSANTSESEPPLFAGVGASAVRRARFVAEYLRCNDATQAYIRAGYKSSGKVTANASRLRLDPEICAAIDAGRRRLAQRAEISARRVRDEYACIAFASIAHYLDIQDDGSERIDLQHVLPEHWAALREIVVEQHIERSDGRPPLLRFARLKLASKQHALDALARHLQLFEKPSPSTCAVAEDEAPTPR
jgi:phage terminase small subunit